MSTPRAITNPTTAKDYLMNINERCLVTFLQRHLINIQEPILRHSEVGNLHIAHGSGDAAERVGVSSRAQRC